MSKKKVNSSSKKKPTKSSASNLSSKTSVKKPKTSKNATQKSSSAKKKTISKKKSNVNIKSDKTKLNSLTEFGNANLDSDYRPTDSEEYMNEKQLAYFKGKLMDWKNELINQSQETLYNLKTESRDVSDEAERASRESDNILELRTRDRYRKLLSKIDSALRRIGDGTYGYCEETGEEIGLRRLEARPTATLTVDAQERREMFQKQFRDDR